MSSFNIFAKANRASVVEEVTRVGSTYEAAIVGKTGHEVNNIVNRLLGQRWKELAEEDRMPYYLHSERDKLRIHREAALAASLALANDTTGGDRQSGAPRREVDTGLEYSLPQPTRGSPVAAATQASPAVRCVFGSFPNEAMSLPQALRAWQRNQTRRVLDKHLR